MAVLVAACAVVSILAGFLVGAVSGPSRSLLGSLVALVLVTGGWFVLLVTATGHLRTVL